MLLPSYNARNIYRKPSAAYKLLVNNVFAFACARLAATYSKTFLPDMHQKKGIKLCYLLICNVIYYFSSTV